MLALPPQSYPIAATPSKAKQISFGFFKALIFSFQVYTKGAIYRQMQEYSRRAATAESRLEEVHKRAVHHDDHIRIIDAWWQQVSGGVPVQMPEG